MKDGDVDPIANQTAVKGPVNDITQGNKCKMNGTEHSGSKAVIRGPVRVREHPQRERCSDCGSAIPLSCNYETEGSSCMCLPGQSSQPSGIRVVVGRPDQSNSAHQPDIN